MDLGCDRNDPRMLQSCLIAKHIRLLPFLRRPQDGAIGLFNTSERDHIHLEAARARAPKHTGVGVFFKYA